MDTSSDTTPKTQKKRTLGLSRHIGVNQSKTLPLAPIETTPKSSDASLSRCKDEITPITTVETTTESLDTSKGYKNETTAIKPNKSIGRVSDSVNSRIAGNTPTVKPDITRHKLSLCKDTNETMTRKRLLSQEVKSSAGKPKRLKFDKHSEPLNKRDDEPKSSAKTENCDTESPSSGEAGEKMNSESPSESLLQKEIDRIKKQITMTEKYQQEIFELKELITKWKAAGLKTIEQIQEKIQPTEVSDILSHFNIDPELFELNSAE